MSDKIRTDSIDLIVTKEDFIDLMDDNAKQLAEIERLRTAHELLEAEYKRASNLVIERGRELERLSAENERLREALQYGKERAGVGLDMKPERVDALNDIYETNRDALNA